MNWVFYTFLAVILVAQIILDHRLKHAVKDARTTKHKNYRTTLLYITLIGAVLGLIENVRKEKRAETSAAGFSSQIKTEGSSTRQEFVRDFQDLSSALATNKSIDSATRLAILNNEENKILQQKKALEAEIETTAKHEPISIDMVSLKTLRAEWGNKHTQWELQNKEAEIQRKREEIEHEQLAKQEALEQAHQEVLQNEQAQLARQEALRQEKHIADQCLSIFDYVIKMTCTAIIGVAKDTGEKVSFDSPSLPTIYQSNFLKEGKIVKGTNFISLGTNTAWNFRISTTGQIPVRNADQMKNQSIQLQRRRVSTLTIKSEGKDGTSSISIVPLVVFVRNETNNSAFPEIGAVSIKLNIPNGQGIDEIQSVTNYTKSVDAALRTLIEAQDQQSPLTIRNN